MQLSLPSLQAVFEAYSSSSHAVFLLVLLPIIALVFFRFFLPAVLGMLKATLFLLGLTLLFVYGGTLWDIVEDPQARVEAEKQLLIFAKEMSKEISSYKVNIDIKKKAVEPGGRSTEENAESLAKLFE